MNIDHILNRDRIGARFVASMADGGNMWQPWCIRASSGHSDFGFARPAELCNILFPKMSHRLGGAFHVTKPSALEGFILRGIVPIY